MFRGLERENFLSLESLSKYWGIISNQSIDKTRSSRNHLHRALANHHIGHDFRQFNRPSCFSNSHSFGAEFGSYDIYFQGKTGRWIQKVDGQHRSHHQRFDYPFAAVYNCLDDISRCDASRSRQNSLCESLLIRMASRYYNWVPLFWFGANSLLHTTW